MLIIFGILIIIASVILGIIVLIQNPKGGGLSSTFGGFGNQVLGVKQTTDVLEKGTWLFGGIVALLCILSPMFIPKGTTSDDLLNSAPTNLPGNRPATQTPATTPGVTAPMPGTNPANTTPSTTTPVNPAPATP